MTSMRVLHVIESLGRGGAETALLTLVPKLQEKGVDVDVACLDGPYDLEPDLVAAGASVHRLHVGRSWSVHLGATRIGRLLRSGKYDLAHAHLFHSVLQLAASRTVAPGIRSTTTFHNLAYLSHPPRGIRKRARRFLHAQMVRHAFTGALAVSDVVARHHEKHLGIGEIEVIANPVNLNLIQQVEQGRGPGLPDWWRNKTGAYEIVVPGRFSPEKGQRFVLDAVAELHRHGVATRIHLIGAGPMLSELQIRATALGIQDQVAFHPPVPQDTLFELFQVADGAIFPSLQEGFGLAAAEAMALGCPVVATRCGGLEEVVTNGVTGILVPPGDGRALASATMHLTNHPRLARRLAVRGRTEIRERYNPSAVAASIGDHYVRLLS